MSCLFCDIVDGKIPSKKVFESESVLAFWDINPAAPVHILVIPKKHVKNILEFDLNDDTLYLDLLSAIQSIVNELKLGSTGFRLLTNTGQDGGQAVDHLHYHILGGRKLNWPPG